MARRFTVTAIVILALWLVVPISKKGPIILRLLGAAQFEIGLTIAEENPEDHYSINYWFEAAASNGNAAALNEIGYMYRYGGFGRTIDIEQAISYFRDAADRGDALAHSNIADLLFYGEGIQPDFETSAWHWRQSVELGYGAGLIPLSIMNNESLIADANREKARLMFIAAQQGEFNTERFLQDQFDPQKHFEQSRYISFLISKRAKHLSRLPHEFVFEIAEQLETHAVLARDHLAMFEAIPEIQTGDLGSVIWEVSGSWPGWRPPPEMSWNDPELHYAVYEFAAKLGNKNAQNILAGKHMLLLGEPMPEGKQSYWLNRSTLTHTQN